MPSSLRWPDAALAGLACSMRSTSGPAVLAARGRVGGRARGALLLAAAGELGVDKSSVATDRIEPPALVGRIASGAFTGHKIAGPVGLAVAAVSAGVGTYSTWRMRKLVVDTTGLPDPVVAAGEDILCYVAVSAATHSLSDADGEEPEDDPGPPSLLRNAAKGLVAGAVGTAVMTIAQGAEFVLTDAQPSDAPATVADKLSRALGRGRIRRRNRPKANQAMHWLHGSAWGIPYGVFAATARSRPELTGPLFGLSVWAVALAEQPALGVADPPWKRSPRSLGSEALFHAVYGLGAGAALRVLRNR